MIKFALLISIMLFVSEGVEARVVESQLAPLSMLHERLHSKGETQLKNDLGPFGAGYATAYESGYKVAAKLVADDVGMFPIKLLSVDFALYDFAAVGSVDMKAVLYTICPTGVPDQIIGITDVKTIESLSTALPFWASIDVSALNITFDVPTSFFAAVIYESGAPGSTPSIVSDSQIGIPSGFNYYCYPGTTEWIEHYSFWASPESIGYSCIRVTVDINHGQSHDVGLTRIITPGEWTPPDSTISPEIMVANLGDFTETFPVYCKIDTSGVQVYVNVKSATLAPGESTTVTFNPWAPGDLDIPYNMTVWTGLFRDENIANDTLKSQFTASQWIFYDDNKPDSAYWGGEIGVSKFAVNFSPRFYPWDAESLKIYLKPGTGTSPYTFEYIQLCPDDGTGHPDTANPFETFYNIGEASQGWIYLDLDTSNIASLDDVWVVIKRKEVADGAAFLGADTSSIAERSWAYTDAGIWQQQDFNWMVRLMLIPFIVGVEGENYELGIRNYELTAYPNPSRGKTVISYRLSVIGKNSDPITDYLSPITISIYDLTGRHIRTLPITDHRSPN